MFPNQRHFVLQSAYLANSHWNLNPKAAEKVELRQLKEVLHRNVTREKKTIIKPFRMTETEARLLQRQAEERDLKESEYIRLLLSQKPNDYPEVRSLLKELINEVNAIGNNINQITRNHNSKIYRKEDTELLIAYMKKLNLLVGEAVAKLGDQ